MTLKLVEDLNRRSLERGFAKSPSLDFHGSELT